MRNNREFDNLSKEIEFQGLEIEFSEKKIREFGEAVDAKKKDIAELTEKLEGRKADLVQKKSELQRGACGGCFNKIPPQKQLDIKLRKKIIVCEYCGRIMIDPELAGVED